MSEQYPLGGMLEPYDIFREKELLDRLEDSFELEDEEDLDNLEEDSEDEEDLEKLIDDEI